VNSRYTLIAVLTAALIGVGAAMAGGDGGRPDNRNNDDPQVRLGFKLSPVPLKTRGRNPELLGLGSYLVNTGGCGECHTHPAFVSGANPFMGQAEVINAGVYMSGGRMFGPVIKAPNITPDEYGRPAGLDFAAFEAAIRTGRKPDGSGRIMQIMPWPQMGKKTTRDLRAMYEYLRSIPSLPDSPNPGP
jgi:hypothetical protein